MLRSVTDLNGFTLRAIDGEIGKVEQCYFDDETWTIRYLVVHTGSWLAGRLVLISPFAVGRTNWESLELEVSLTKKQVEGSPAIDTHKPVSRQHEAEHLRYYGYPLFWNGPYLWGSMSYPADLAGPSAVAMEASASRAETESADFHLRSTKEVIGYRIEAIDGEIGHVETFIVDYHTWAIRYIEVNTRNWWPGKKVLISPRWIDRVSWMDSKVHVDLSREAIKNGPEYIDSVPITREYEFRLWDHHKRPAYWQQESEQSYRPTVGKD
jgi:hypothetical protein